MTTSILELWLFPHQKKLNGYTGAITSMVLFLRCISNLNQNVGIYGTPFIKLVQKMYIVNDINGLTMLCLLHAKKYESLLCKGRSKELSERITMFCCRVEDVLKYYMSEDTHGGISPCVLICIFREEWLLLSKPNIIDEEMYIASHLK